MWAGQIQQFRPYIKKSMCKQSETELKGKYDRFQAKIFISQPEDVAIFLKYLGNI